MIGYPKKIEKIIRESAFDKKKKKPGLKFNPGLALTGVRTTGPRDFKPRVLSVGGERCPAAVFKFFVERRPVFENMRRSGSLYHSIRPNRKFNDKLLVQTKRKGENTISNIMKTIHSWY